jgi:endonuclease/exonuclease/phosphatase family metal-dependent hydrolase
MILLGLLPSLAAAATPPSATPATMPSDLRVMSFNIRLNTPKDMANAWPLRKDVFFKTIETFAPDLMGLQEVTPPQGEEIKSHFKAAYDFLGVPRNDGKTSGEMAAVLFRRDRFERVRDGTFWLSQTPDVVGSKGWDADLPRVVTWVELRDRRNADRPLLFLNTHFDHIGKVARVESVKLMRQKMVEVLGDKPLAVIVTGDFNVPQDSPPYKQMLGGPDAPPRLTDTFKDAHPQPTTRDFTWHGFVGENPRGAQRIDWVLRSDAFQTIAADIDRANDNGKYPSDHFPVEAVLRWKD